MSFSVVPCNADAVFMFVAVCRHEYLKVNTATQQFGLVI